MTTRREHQKTFPSSRIAETLLMLMRLHGGAKAEVDPASVYAPLADFYELSQEARRLSAAEYYAGDSPPGVAWNSEVDAAVKRLKKDGLVTVAARTGQSAWRLTPLGVERADFWLRRMIDKSAALKSLKLAPNPACLETAVSL